MRYLLPTLIFAVATQSTLAQDLRLIESRHYSIHTDLDDDFANDLARRMDGMYDEYSTRLAAFGPVDDSQPLQAWIFRNQSDYINLVGPIAKGTRGMFIPQRQLLAAYLQKNGRDDLRRTLQHEAFHQFADRAISHNLPTWLNEGLAQVFEEGIWTGDAFLLGQVPPYRLRQLQSDIASPGLLDFRDILTIQPEQWASHWDSAPAAALEYNQAWAMTHFLVFARDESGQPKYRARLLAMLKDLHSGMDADEAFREDFSANIDGFHARFMEWAQGVTVTPLAQAMEDQRILADIDASLANRGQKFDSLTALRQMCVSHRWQMHYRRGNLTWESNPNPGVYFVAEDLHLESSDSAPLPDLVCVPQAGLELRTRFFMGDSGIEHETIVEPAR